MDVHLELARDVSDALLFTVDDLFQHVGDVGTVLLPLQMIFFNMLVMWEMFISLL